MNRIATLCWLLVAAVLFAGHASGQGPPRRLALVVGNDDYVRVAKLKTAVNDAHAMERELTAAGFQVTKYLNVNDRAQEQALRLFTQSLRGGDEVVFFYAGHGVQIKTGTFLLPTDIEVTSERELEKFALGLQDAMDMIAATRPAFALIIVDACRDNPLPKAAGRSVGTERGLIPMEPAKGQMVIYSAGKGQSALDRLSPADRDPNGVFTREFIKKMRQPGVKVRDIVDDVQDSVEKLARSVGHEQRPSVYSEARGNFYFFGPTASAAPSSGTAAVAPGQRVVSPAEREDSYWNEAKTIGTSDAYQAYLDQYPSGQYAGLARANIKRLTAAPTIVAAAAASSSTDAARPSAPEARSQTQVTPVAAVPAAAAVPVAAPVAVSPVAVSPGAAPVTAAPPPTAATPQVVALATPAPQVAAPIPPITPAATPVPAAAGRTRVTMPNGDSYEGEVLGAILSGQGIYVFANGDRYEGGFADNKFSGKGLHVTKAGDRYEGEFVNGLKQGRGTYTFANGDRYEGEILANLFSGKGKLSLAGGGRYEGDFRDSAKHGKGVHYFPNGERYEGEFAIGVQSGAGTHYYANGDKYTGQFANGVRDGKGMYRYANGDTREFVFERGVEKAK